MSAIRHKRRFPGFRNYRWSMLGRGLAFRMLGFLCLALPMTHASANAEDFPSRTITLVVPFAAGGSLDATARIVAQKMREYLGQPVVVVNKPGAGSSVGARSVATAKPDGYTIFLASGSAYGFMHLLVPGYTFRLSDFVPIAGIATNTSLFAVNTDVPANTLSELLEYARGHPDKINFCTTGAGGLNHLQLEQLKGLVKERLGNQAPELTHVPYNGVAPALTALRAKDVQVCTLPFSSLVKNLDGKDIRIIAVMTPRRLRTIAHVPTTGEQGFAELDGNDALVNVSAPANTPQPVLAKLEQALHKSLEDPEIRDRLEDLDVQPTFVDSTATKKWLEQDVRKFESIIRNAEMAVAE